jgi:hypothetical protein
MLRWVAKAQQPEPVKLIPEPEVNTEPVVSYQVDHLWRMGAITSWRLPIIYRRQSGMYKNSMQIFKCERSNVEISKQKWSSTIWNI